MELKEQLLKLSKEKLADIVLNAVELLSEEEKIDFVAKHIDAKAVLSYIGENDSNLFIKKTLYNICKKFLINNFQTFHKHFINI